MIGLLALAAASVGRCPAERSHYVLRHTPGVSAYFRAIPGSTNRPSGLALAIHSRKSGQTSWWLPWRGGTDNLQHIASTRDVTAPGWRPPNPDDGPRPFGDREYLGADADYNIINDIPRRGKLAPVHMLIPNAGSSGDPVFVAKQFFDFVSCSAKGRLKDFELHKLPRTDRHP